LGFDIGDSDLDLSGASGESDRFSCGVNSFAAVDVLSEFEADLSLGGTLGFTFEI
jgi:hypothetical protein